MRVRPSPSALFVAAAVMVAAGVGIVARSAAGSEDQKVAHAGGLPSDVGELGFVATGAPASGVALLDATHDFRIELGHGPIRGVAAAPARLAVTRAIVSRELGRYPRAFLAAIHLRGVVFADDLREGETSIPSLPNVAGLLLLDVAGSESDLVRGLHHEVFHFADLADDGSLAPDPSWDALNAPGFTYGAGGRTLRSAWAGRAPESDGFLAGGFVSPYATSGAEEDKAETFAFAVARPVQVKERAAHDAILTAKLHEIARRIGTLDPETPRMLALDY
ncbi:MAG: putative lipoprotein [Myxococcaceae bacterium]|nr:putative lipoprotein [Myxococcaceae bacterium]